jgi:competence protein ComEA
MTIESDRTGQKQTQLSAFVTAVVVCSAFSILLAVSYLVRAGNSCNIVLDDKINPNTATIASLVRLPNIGPKRAEVIVEYRETLDSGGPAFGRSADLEKIKGIGPKTSRKIQPWLCFD